MTDAHPPDGPSDGSDDNDLADEQELVSLLSTLKQQHRQIDQEIEALYDNGTVDMLKIRRMKKIKLRIKDKIAYVEDQLTPDIIA